MSYTLVMSPRAVDQAAGFLQDDKSGVAAVVAAIDALLDDPRPPASTAWGADAYRLRVGRYRILYEISGTEIRVRRIGRVAAR